MYLIAGWRKRTKFSIFLLVKRRRATNLYWRKRTTTGSDRAKRRQQCDYMRNFITNQISGGPIASVFEENILWN